jgi:1,4-dihydroxy-2-naphthoate octaprenyltransferase
LLNLWRLEDIEINLKMIKHWIEAFRLRTLPLALASIGMGSFIAAADERFSWLVFGLTSLTTIFLQVLSNLANDYGDSQNGADSVERKGPQRAVQSGVITPKSMLKGVIILAILSLISGLSLLYFALESMQLFWLFLGFGILSIVAAVTYTAGNRPYGYAGLGDLSVFIFFGWLGVMGTYFLHTQALDLMVLLPATTCSCFAVAVLNINNIRDIDSDEKAGKITIPVRIGREKAVRYHFALLIVGVLCAVVFIGLRFENFWAYSFVLVLPLLFKNAKAVYEKTNPTELDPYLKQMALTTLLFVIVFGMGLLLG